MYFWNHFHMSEVAMNIRIQNRFLLFCALMLASVPAFAQSVRLIWQGAAYGYADDQTITEGVIDQVIGTQVREGAQVVFFRPDDSIPGTVSLNEGDTPLAQLPGGSYYAIAVTPGAHTYALDGAPLQLQIAPGERRYVRINNRNANPQLLPSHALTFLRTTLGKRPPLY
jgi:hypothetical protein